MKGLKDIIGIDYGKLQDELHKEMSESEQNTRERQEQAYMDEARRNAREFDLPARERTLKDDFAQGFGTFEPARRQLRKDEQVAENLSTDYMAYVGSKDVAKAANAFDLPEMQRNYAISPTRHVGIERSQDFTVDEKQRREVERPTHKSSEYTEARAVRPGERSDDGRIFRRTLGGIMPEARHDTFGFAKIAKSRRDNQAERLANNFNSLLEDAMSFEPGSYNTDHYREKSDTIAAAESNLRELVRRERGYDDKLYSFFDTDEGKRVARPILDKYSDGKAREAAKMYDIDEDTAVQRVTAEREKRLQEAFEGSDYYQKWLFGTQYGQAYNALNKAQRLNAAKYLDVDTSKQQKDVDNMNLAQSIDESKDYYKQELDRLEKEATEKDIKEGWVDENTRRYMLSGGRLSPINMPSENQKTLEAAARAYNDIAETQAEHLREGNTTALGRFFRGAGNAATDKRTWDFGFSHLNDAVELEKAAQAVEQGKATKAQELLVNLSALKNVVTSEYGDVLGGMYGAGRTTTEMLPFMLQMIMTPTTGVVRAATGKIAGVLAKKMGKEAAEKAARFFAEKLTGKVIKTIGKGVQKVTEATERGTVAQALYGMPTTLADTQERMTGAIKADISDDGKIVYAGREKGDDLIDAARKSYIANNLEYTTEMLGSLFRPAAQAMKRGVKAFTDYATKNGINLSKIYDFFAMTDKKGMVQIWDKFAKKGFYDGPVGEYGEEVINNLGNAILVGDLNFNSPDDPNSVFNPKLNFDTFLAVAMGSAFMGGLGRINYGWTIFQKRTADNLLNAQLDNWSSLKDDLMYEATANDALKDGFEKIAYYEKSGSISRNQADALKKSLADYANITWWQKGLDMREEKEQEAAEDTQADNTGTTAQDAATVDVVTAGQGEAVNAGQQPVQSPTDVLTSVNTESMPSAGEAVDVDPGREYRSAGRDFAEAEAELDARENSNDHNKAAAAQIIKSSSDLFTAQAILNERALDTEDNLALAERYFSSLERSKALEDEMLARANEETDNIIHKDTDSVVEVTDRDGNAGYVISGGVSVEDDGTVSATDDTVMVKSADGTVRQIPAVELQFTTPATSRDDYAHRMQARMQVRDDVPEPVAGIAFTDDDGIRHTVTGVDTAGNIVVSDDLGETTTISRDDYNYFMSNALDKQEEQAQAAGQAKVQPQESQPVAGPVTAGQPQNVEHSSTDVQGTGENVLAVEKNVENIQQEAPQEVDEVSKEERSEMENRIVDWLSEDNLSKAYGKTREEIFNEFGNELEPIAYIPAQFISLVDPELTDTRIYCGKGYFIDHALRNHAGSGRRIAPEDVDVSKYLNMQYVLDNPDSIKETVSDGKRTVVFIKKIGRYFAELTQVEENGKLVLHKSLFNQKKEPYAKLDDIRPKQASPEGGVSSISHADNAAPAISLQSRDDVNSISSVGKGSEKAGEIPTDGKGNLLYHEVPVEKTVAYLYNSGLTDEEIQGFIEANIAASREKYERSAQKQPKIGTDIAKYKAKKAQWRSSVDGAKKQYDYWQAVDTYIKEQTHTTEEEVSAARAELEGDNARREYASISGDIQGDAVVTAAQFISDKKITPESFRRETGYGKDEQRRFVGMIASKEKGGESIERLAERLAEDDADNNNGALYHGDDYNAKSAILEALQRYGTRGALKKGEDDMLADKYAEEKSEERDAHYMDAYHMDYADYLAAREQEMPDILRKYGNFDKDEYYSLYAEEIEQRLKGIENEQRTDSEREEPADDRSDKVLPGERLDDGGGIAESAEPERKGDNGNGSPVPHGYVQEGSSAGEVAEKIAQAEAETDTNPTEAQKEAGNYKKGHVRIDGFDITIENPKGSVRSGVDAKGKRWENTMNNTYGYMRGTEGVDGDHIDVFLSDNPEEGNVYVVDQQNPETGEFDEHKVMYGFNSMEEAKEAYLANYTPGWKGLGTITEVSKDEFKRWINSSHRKTKPFAEYKSVNKTAGQDEANEAATRDAAEQTLAEEAHKVFSEIISKSTHNVEINNKEVLETENTLYAPINVDGKRTNLSLYQTEPVLSSEDPIIGVSYYSEGLTYQEAYYLSEEYNQYVGKIVCTDGDDALDVHFGNIDEAVRFEEWLKERGNLIDDETAIRDAVVERLRESGIDVITDTEAGQRVLDEANGKQKISLETDSVPEEEHLRTVISSDSGAKVLKNIDNLINEYENSSYTKEKTFIGNIAKALSARQYGSGSEYATFETVNGKIVTIRLANHSASSKRMDNAGRDNAISIVISSKPNTGVFNDGKAHIVEFYYNSMKLRRAEGKPLVEILKSIKQALYSGEYKDTTGLAEVQEVNGETIREHRVYHGSGADFEAFDHSHMGEGEGAQAYGWGSYVTEVKGIGKSYATSNEEKRAKLSISEKKEYIKRRKRDIKEMGDYERYAKKIMRNRRNSEKEYKAAKKAWNEQDMRFYEDLIAISDSQLKRENHKALIDSFYDDINKAQSEIDELEAKFKGNHHLYTVEIPDDTGENYLDWEKGPTEKQGERIREALLTELDSRGMRSEENIAGLERQWKLAYEADGRIGGAIYYNIIRRVAGSDKAASELLSKIGFTGISYPAQATTGGRADGARNYVIFNEKDLKITDHVRFFRTENGKAYGFTVGGKIYLDPRMATADTPIHEYAHLWAGALREANPDEWKHIAELLRGTPVWDEVKRRYPELETDDEIADEVLATYSGRRGAERLRDEARKIAEGKGSPIDKAEAVSALQRVREALQRFWKGVADFLHIHYASAEDVADRVMRDLAEGVNPQKSSKGNMQNPAVEKIEDVGEKIGGARKDRFAEYMEKSKQVEDKPESFMEQLRKLPVSKMFNFPLDALRKDGLSNEAATLIDIIRRMIPAKPRSEWKLKRWTENVFRLYRMCLTLGTADKKMLDDILERIQRERIISGMYRAQMALGGFDSGKDTGTAMLEQLGDNAGHYDKNGEWVSAKGQWYVSHAGRYGGIYPDFEKAKEVLEKFAGENTKTSGSKKDVQFSIYMNNADKSCFITVKGKPDMVVQSGFKTAKDATNYLNEHIDDLREKYRNFKESTNIGFRPNGERIGKDWRGGKDVAAEDFRKAFGFRGVEFGNWTNQKERQSALNQAYDAFMDLSEATGISPQGLSLGGELGIAFGARGGGKAAAHYESGKVVINLTKTQGAGTLAHEWWHAIDNYFSRRRGHSAGYNTERRDYKLTREDGKLKRTDEKERTEITDAFGELMKAIEESDYGKRSNRYASIKSNYWKDPTELGARAFAVWVERKLSEKGIVDDFLANNNTLGWDTPELTQKYFPYPMESDFESLDMAFDNLFNAIEEKTDEETGNTILYRFIGEKGAARLDAAEESTLQEANERFNEELDKWENGDMTANKYINVGSPKGTLQYFMPKLPIILRQKVLSKSKKKHGLSATDMRDLPVALAYPIFVFKRGNDSISVLTELENSKGENVFVAIELDAQKQMGHQILNVNDILTIHGREIENVISPIIENQSLVWVNKEKGLNWLSSAKSKSQAITNEVLDSAANIVKNFNNPEGSGGNLHGGASESAADNSPEAIARRNAERKERITGRVRAFAEENGLGEVDIIESADDTRVPDRVRREIEGGSVVSGWYDTRTGRVALYYPTVTGEADALRTVAHEAIGHKGLRAVIGEDTYNEFLDYIDRNADEDIAKRINAKESETGNRRVAVDEVLAEIAEREAGEPVHLNLLQRIAGWIRDALRRIGVDTEITVGQAQYYIWRSRRNAGKGGLTDTARDTVMRRKTRAKDVLNVGAGMRTSAESEAEALQEVNKRFNEELSGLTEENADKVTLMLGWPSIVLRAAGVIDKPMKLYGAKVIKKMKKHGFALAELQNLPEAVANPIAVFNNYNKPTNRAILTELRTDKGNFLVTVDVGKAEKDIDFNIVSSVFGKSDNKIVNWINKGFATYINKEKALSYLHHSAPIAEALSSPELDSAANIINNFENPETGEENIRFRKSPRQRAIEAADNAVRTYRESAADLYHNTLERSMFRFTEAFQDGMRSVRVLVDSILTARGESINDLKEYEDAYRAENHCASKSMNEFDQYRNRLYNPVIEAARRVMETSGLDTDGLRHYLFAKSGLERNREFTVRDIYKIADKANDEAQRRYATAKRKVEEAKASDEWKTLTGEEKKELELTTSNAEKRADEKKAALDATEAIVNEYRELEEKTHGELENGYISFEEYCDVLDEFVTNNIDKDYNPAERDYSGFKSMFKGEADYKKAALALVNEVESRSAGACNDLWKKIKTATDYLLNKQAEGGLISHSQADMLKKRSNWYVPMRGWNEITTADVYDYVNNWNRTQGRRKEKEAGGRGSEAGDPIAQIIYIAQNTIEEANRNEVKQRFLDFVLNHMSDLATVHPAWVRLNEKGEWEYAAPDIEEGDSAEQIEQKIKTFEANMQAEKEAGRASRINSKARLNVDMVVIPRTEDEHTVLVRRGGRMFTIIINGNPRAAQALNGWLQRQQQGDVARVFNRAMRGIAMLITSKAPNFILRNGMRDFGYAADTLMVREGKDYAARFLKNYAAIIPAREHSIFKLLEKFKESTLDTEHDDVERMFSEFMLNGAETGYINYQNVEKWRSDIENLLKKDPKGITEKGKKNLKKAWKGTWDYVETLNRGAEDLVRFATYMTSRQEGRSIFTSVDNAKNVSVNFNRSGAGYNGQGWWRYPAGFMRGWFMFFNAGVQGLTNFLYNFKAAPGRSTARAIARGIAGSIVPYFTLGFLNGLLHGLYGGDDGDDGKDGYFDLTDYTRRTNFIIGGFGDYYIMLPLPIELRAFYGAGEAFAGVLTGKQHAEDAALSAVASLFELLPVNPVEMYENPANLAGGVFSPIAQAVMNENFMGVPLYKDTPWNEEAPAYTKAYAGTPKILVDISRSINELTGGNEYKTGRLGKTDNVINNPAITYHLLRSYLGGVAQVFGQVFNLMGDYIVPNAETAITGEGEYNTDRIFREIPFFSVLVTQNDERTGYSLTNKLYHDMKEQADRRKDLLGKYFADGNKQKEINEMLEDSKANAKDDVILFYDGILKDLNEQAKGSTEEESEQIKITINKVRKVAVLNASEAAGEPLTLNMPQTRLQEQLGTGEAYIAEHMTIPDALEEGELRRLKSQASKNPNTTKNKITLTIIRRYESFKRKMSDAMEYSDDMGYNLNTIREARKGMLEYLRGM